VNDQLGRPTYTVDLAIATWKLLGRRANGTMHVTNGGPVATWFDLAHRVFERAGATSLLSPCASADYPTPARRPSYSALSTAKVESTLGRALPDWRDALDRFLTEIT
jgi:dTDP-4-dehydrorhamnose reductase